MFQSTLVQQQLVKLIANYPCLVTALFGIGGFSLARLLLQTLSVFVQTFILPGKPLTHFGARKGAWAVVTGATDGIGKEFALQLAKAGFNILLVARNREVLASTAAQIATKYGVQTASCVIDFAKAGPVEYAALETACAPLDIGVLVNNVGKSHAIPAYLVDTPKSEIDEILEINVGATVSVTYMILPGMVKRKRGLILNVGSFAGAVPSPMLATYSGSKAFLATFSSALAEEVKQHNVIVEHLNTYFVVSKLSKIRRATALIPTPAAYVRAVLTKIGLACGAAYSGRPNAGTPYWSHALLDYGIKLVGIKSLFISYTHWLHRDIRKRALRKMEREAKGQ